MKTIRLHVQAPAKPDLGQACNGCGLCCASEPCPLGMLVSRKRRGACHALRWNETTLRYECGLLIAPADFLPRFLRGAARWLPRYIAAGSGCDADITVIRDDTSVAPSSRSPDHPRK